MTSTTAARAATGAKGLAIQGAEPALPPSEGDERLFHWPIVTAEDEQAVLDVMRAGTMSGTSITKQFEAEYATWQGSRHALCTCNGTAGLTAAMWACGVGVGDEIICPTITYWASASPALMLGATVNFADIDAKTLCIDPNDIEHRIGPRTRAIVVVNYAGHPADYDRIMPLARKHGLKVIEDNSHAQGSMYKGKMCGSLGDIAAASLMAGKAFPIGEGGIITTDDPKLYERCVAFGHYERTGVASNYNPVDQQVHDEGLLRFKGLPMGAAKHRLNQMCAAMGRVQLKSYPARIVEIQKAINRFWDLLDGVPGLRPHRIDEPNSSMGGWYFARGLYTPEELGGLSAERFCEAVRAEGVKDCAPVLNRLLHTHAYFHEADVFGHGKPTAVAFGQRDVRQGPGTLPVAEQMAGRVVDVPWFKHDDAARIEQYAAAYRKVAEHAHELLEADKAAQGAAG
ncbi:DegT/DnrJ/EryC1/StrS family aminotransferase [Phycisphaerales bacterium AB-hyl4]|uniref:DegT/DnrJ/EryC1/StrS family aminotransferase n=1 Tax=Natronomicrosphaera hydrolytica TaxID=3242702 RepID=A0ABV4U7C6_9BACT